MRRRPAAPGVIAVTVILAGCGSLLGGAGGSGNGADAGNGTGAAPAASAASPAARPPAPYDISGLVHPASGKFLGLEAPGLPGSLAPAGTFAANIGHKPNLIGQYVAWWRSFDPAAVARAWSYGALTYLAWEPFKTSPRAIADGRADSYITQFAQAVRKLNLPVVLSFGHEMNGDWYPWGSKQSSPADFVAAWRHIHKLFGRAGARNVIWMWNPNIINPMPQVRLRPYFPGNAYVDWVGVTGYFPATGPQTYATLYRPTITEIRAFTRKPILIAETSVETGPAEVACINQLVDAVTQHSGILGFIWFDYNKDGIDWRVESRPILRAALARDLSSMRLADLHGR